MRGGVLLNFLVLIYFKYTNFFIEIINFLFGSTFPPYPVGPLPLGISFFTFTQIAFLIDAHYTQLKEVNFFRYGLFVTYFPHLVAGPILHHEQTMKQLRKFSISSQNFSLGLLIFSVGLFKKILLADPMGAIADPVFQQALTHFSIGSVDAWLGSLAYTLQIYFDFSGYSDMAVGISYLFNIKIPINFYSPYQAESIIEFWRRWHISLSRFMRDYLYIPLGGSRRGHLRTFINLLATMLVVGIWHGAGFTFLVWGGLHGIFLIVNRIWRYISHEFDLALPNNISVYILSRSLTFMCVLMAWIPFRSPNMKTAIVIWESLLTYTNATTFYKVLHTYQILSIFFLLFIVTILPNIYKILRDYDVALYIPDGCNQKNFLSWKQNYIWLIISVTIFVLPILFLLTQYTSAKFLYFDF